MGIGRRQHLPKSVEKEVLLASRRRCCLCVFLDNQKGVRRGQIAHLNGNPSDSRFENLVWLCLEHHDEYDSTSSQAKGLTVGEIRSYRDRLYGSYEQQRVPPGVKAINVRTLDPTSEYEDLKRSFSNEIGFTSHPWRYPLWQVGNEPDLFAYKAGNGSDGVCLLERVDLPDGRIVVACMETPGNPGNSITNCVEELCFQVCERFEIPAKRVVWLEHYDDHENGEWNLVTFEQMPPEGLFDGPAWTIMTPALWKDLRLRPKKRLTQWNGHYRSKLRKLFEWPTEALQTPDPVK